jgi:hypothetical protein
MQIPTVFFFWGAQIEESIAKKEPKYNHLRGDPAQVEGKSRNNAHLGLPSK